MLVNTKAEHSHPRWVWPAVALILVLAVGLRSLALGVDGFWLDEIFGASYTNLNPLDVVTAVLRFDIHPPLYYLQLKLWSYVSHTDAWLSANSIAWSVCTVLIGSMAAYRLGGVYAGLFSAAMLAVLGSEIYFASELRMYAMISCLTVIAWIRADAWSEKPSKANAAWLIGILCLLAGVHSIAFVPISSVLLFAFISCQMRHGIRTCLAQGITIAGITAAALLPCLLNASFRSVSHTAEPTLQGAVETISGWALGYGSLDVSESTSFVVGLVILGLIALGLIARNTPVRLLLGCFVAWPVLVLFGISVTLRPVWIERAVAFCAPFFVIAMALLLVQQGGARSGRQWMREGVVTIIVVGLAWIAAAQAVLPRKMQYREAAAFIARENSMRLPVHIPQNFTFWGMARYLDRPRWGNLLEVQDPVRPDESEAWNRIYARLGPVWLERLHLIPKTRELASPAGPLWIGLSPLPSHVAKDGLWLVGNNNLLKETALCGTASQLGLWRFTGVVVVKCGRAS